MSFTLTIISPGKRTSGFQCSQGALVGCLGGVTFNLWIGIGAMTIVKPSTVLPPAPVDGCVIATNTSMFNYTTVSNTVHSTDMYTTEANMLVSDETKYDL